VPKFVQVKKLPFEIGFIALRGTSLSKDAYQQIYFKAIYQLLASKTISISTIEPISDVSALVWIHESSGYDMEEL
jgi:phage terminase large subunit-like protein